MNGGLPPFRLYGLLGCPHCGLAEQFLRSQNLPTMIIAANDDPIAEAGVKWAMKQKNPELKDDAPAVFPILVCTFGKQIVEGFKEDEYRRLADAWHILSGTTASINGPSALDSVNSGQQPNGQATTPPPETATGAN